jgi:histidinol phosphatase-like enzyme
MFRTTKAVFLDKDGLLHMDHPCRRLSEGHVEWFPETIKGLRLLYLAGYALICTDHSHSGG